MMELVIALSYDRKETQSFLKVIQFNTQYNWNFYGVKETMLSSPKANLGKRFKITVN